MIAGSTIERYFPWSTVLGDQPVTLRLMTPDDRDEVLRFVQSLPEQDLFYLMDDIRQPQGMDRWIESIRQKLVTTVLAEAHDTVVGYASLRPGHARWTSHLGEIRIMVASEWRGAGLGKLLARHLVVVAQDAGLWRIVVRLTSAQTPARYLFQQLGFQVEAVLADCVLDNEQRTQDLFILSYDVTGFHGGSTP